MFLTLGYERMLCAECEGELKPIIAATLSFSGNGYFALKRYERIDGKLERLAYEVDVACDEKVLNQWIEAKRLEVVPEDKINGFYVVKLSSCKNQGLPVA